jgi:hypothetical protein
VSPAWTRAGVAAACALGDIIDVSVLPGQGRDLDPGNAPRDWVFARFANEPAPNSCNLTQLTHVLRLQY